MLVLSRRVGEKVLIGGDIQVTILAIKGNQVRVGIEAPMSLTILRDELQPFAKPANTSCAERQLVTASL